VETVRCCVCHRQLPEEESRRIGSRDFCKEHHERAMEATRAHWTRAGLIETALCAAFVATVAFTLGSGDGAALPTSIGTGLVLALIPAFIFLVYIYRQDRLEPEPWGLVLGVFLVGGLLGWAIAEPIAEEIFRVEEWRNRSPLASAVAGIAVSATLSQLCAYLAVRYTVYLTDEFDEPVDGIIYVSAAGLGMATVQNIAFVVESEGVLPLAGATFIASTTLIHVASAAVLGYGLGRARFSEGGQAWLAGAFALSILVHGGLHQLATLAAARGGTFNPWLALAVALGIGAVVLVASHLLTAHLWRQSLKEGPVASV
jgi:RsiW-degrading membrane proteinase PrsW (M82 family)